MSKKTPELLMLARNAFAPRRLSLAEENLFKSASAKGKHRWRGDSASDVLDFDDESVIHGNCIAWLCSDVEASSFVPQWGLCLENLRIEGELNLGLTTIKFALRILGCDFSEDIGLNNAHLSGVFFEGCRIKNLRAWGVKVDGPVVLRCPFNADGKPDLSRRFRAEGTINLEGATIGGHLDCSGAEIVNSGNVALTAAGARIGGNVCMSFGYRAQGETKLVSATIGGNVECQAARLLNAGATALTLNSAKVGGNVYLCDGFKAEGIVDLAGASIAGLLQITGVHEPAKAEFFLAWVKVHSLLDHVKSWPKQGNLLLQDFQYETLHHLAPTNAKSRIEWLALQPRSQYWPQPYEQLASVLRTMGYIRDAKLVMIEQNKERAREIRERAPVTRFFRQGWWWYNVFGRWVGYGYKPLQAFLISLSIIFFGSFLFQSGYSSGLILPTNRNAYESNASADATVSVNAPRPVRKDYPVFNSFVYSTERFVPFLKLDQSANWRPNANCGETVGLWPFEVTTGAMLEAYLLVHVIFGWVFTSLWIGAVAGLLRN